MGGKSLCKTLWEREDLGLNLYSLEGGVLSIATLDNAANIDIQMMFLMHLEKPEKMWRLLAQMAETRHSIIHTI